MVNTANVSPCASQLALASSQLSPGPTSLIHVDDAGLSMYPVGHDGTVIAVKTEKILWNRRYTHLHIVFVFSKKLIRYNLWIILFELAY